MHRNILLMVNVQLSQLKDAVQDYKAHLMEVINVLQRRAEVLELEKKTDQNVIDDLKKKNDDLEKKLNQR